MISNQSNVIQTNQKYLVFIHCSIQHGKCKSWSLRLVGGWRLRVQGDWWLVALLYCKWIVNRLAGSTPDMYSTLVVWLQQAPQCCCGIGCYHRCGALYGTLSCRPARLAPDSWGSHTHSPPPPDTNGQSVTGGDWLKVAANQSHDEFSLKSFFPLLSPFPSTASMVAAVYYAVSRSIHTVSVG